MKAMNYVSIMAMAVASQLFSPSVFAASSDSASQTFPERLYKALAQSQSGNGFVYSPYSVSEAFGMASLGARGDTLKEIEKAMGMPGTPPGQDTNPAPADELFVANRLWIQEGFSVEKDFLDGCKAKFGAEPGLLDFEKHASKATATINQWVEKQTQGKIRNLISPRALDRDSRLVLTNAVYFKSNWQSPFEPEQTYDEDFITSPEKKSQVSMMHHRARFKYTDDDQVQVVQLPYRAGRYAMVVVLPKASVTLAQVEKGFTFSKITEWETALKPNNIQLSLPRFQMDASFLLNESLKKIGLRNVFEGNEADFSGIDGKKDLFIAQVFHKAFLKVYESGTEAAAATAIHMALAAVFDPQKPIEFAAKRPFIFYIEEVRSRKILFLGRLTDPQPITTK